MSAVLEPRTIDIQALAGTNVTTPVEIGDLEILPHTQEETRKGYGTFRLLHPKFGDQRVVWNSHLLADIQAAKKLFMDLIQKGLKPYRVGADGKSNGEIMSEFDPTAEEIVFVPIPVMRAG